MAAKRLSVLLETEGTYPYAGGGVSTWCDILCREMEDVDFTIFTVTGNPIDTFKYELPKNVTTVKQIPLWGTEEPSEYLLPDTMVADIYLKKKKTTQEVIAKKFLPLFDKFIYGILYDVPDTTFYGYVIYKMYRYFQMYDFKVTFKSKLLWDKFKQEIIQYYRMPGNLVNEEPNIFDITTAMRWIYHYLLPISVPVPKTDITHTTITGFCGLISVIAKIIHDTPMLVTDHGVFIRERYIAISSADFRFFAKRFLLKLSIFVSSICYFYADQISPVCDFNQRWELLFCAKQEKIKTIYNSVDTNVFQPKAKSEKWGRRPTVVAAAHIFALKDIETMILSCNHVRKEIPDVKYVVYGSVDVDKPYAAKCRKLIDELNLGDNFEMAGYHNKPSEIFNDGDISVLTSISEGFPYTVLESMSCSRPVVATDVGGVKEAIGEFGIVVKPRDANAVGDGVIKLLKDRELTEHLGRKGRERVLTRFHTPLTVEKYYESYLQLTKEQKSAQPNEASEKKSSQKSRRDNQEIKQEFSLN